MISSKSENNILSYCRDELEKQRVLFQLRNYKRDFYISTTFATFHVQKGIPELIELKRPKYLSQSKINDVINLFRDEDGNPTLTEFKILWTIIESERNMIDRYQITDGVRTVTIDNGDYSLSIQ